MSNDISYVIKAIDAFTPTIKKIQAEVKGFTQSLSQSGVINSNVSDRIRADNQKIINSNSGVADSYRRIRNNMEGIGGNFSSISSKKSFFSSNLVDLGKAAGIYASVSGAMSFGKSVFNTRIQMDSLNASLTAIMPKFDKTKPAAQAAAEEIEYLKNVTNKLGISFQQALPSYMQFLASSKQDLPTTRRTFEAFSGIARLYGLSAERFGLVITALNQMQSKGVVSMEELRQQLGESLPGALDLFAESAGMSTQQFIKLVGEGRIGAGILKNVAETIEKKFGKDVVAAAQTLGAETERLSNSWLNFKNVLSKNVSPVLTLAVTNLTAGINGLTIAMQFLFEKGQKVASALEPITNIISRTAQGIRDFGAIGAITGYGALGAAQTARGYLWGGSSGLGGQDVMEGQNKLAIANDAGSQLLNQMFNRNLPEQKVSIDVNLNNAPRGTTTQISRPASKNVRVGNIVNYGEE